MTSYHHANARTLSDSHHETLEVGSAISLEVIDARGVWTINRPGELPGGYNERQRRRAPGMLFTIHRPNGRTATVFRPDKPYSHNPKWKYEQVPKANGGGNVLDVHPFCHPYITDQAVPVIFTEGTKKADALVSAFTRAGQSVVVVGIVGVWNWVEDGCKPVADMYDIPLEGRSVTIMFDSDAMSKWQVQLATRRLAEHTEGRGARVYVTYFADQPDGSKTGADDFFAAGGTISELRLLTRRYDPADFALIRLSRDETLRAAVEDLWRRFWAEEWKGMGGASARDVYLKLIEAAKHYGQVHEDGIRVEKAHGPLALEAKVSTRTLWKAIKRLEEWDLVYRDNEGWKPGKSGAFVLRANVSHNRTSNTTEGNDTMSSQVSYARDLHLRSPRLRWSQPKYTPRRGLVKDTRKVRQAPKADPRPAIKRLGKIRGAIIDALDAVGGMLTLKQIAEILHRKRPRDIRRRNLPMLEDAGIIQVSGDAVSLADDWLEALEEQRRIGKEVEAEELAERRYKIKSCAYHNRRKTAKSEPSDVGLAAVRESRDRRREHLHAHAGGAGQDTPPDAEPVARRRRVEQLVREGMARRFAEAEVISTSGLPDGARHPSRTRRPSRKTPPKVNGIYIHGPECDCWLCSEADDMREGVA